MRPNYKNKKKNLIVKTYEKSFENLKEMIEDLQSLHPEMSVIFPYEYTEVNSSMVAEDVLDYFAKNAPDVIKGVNLPVTVSISANSVSLKTAKYFSIKWNFKYDPNGFITDIKALITTFGRDRNSENFDIMIDILENQNSGWNIVERER